MVSNSTIEMLKNQMLQTTLPVLYLSIFSISIPLNSISLWFLCYYSRPWSSAIVFAINLTITDLLYSVLLPFQAIYHLQGNNWHFGPVLCRVVTVLFYGNMYCSLLTMSSISFERYLGIVCPLRYQRMRSIRTALLTCIIMWAFVLLLQIPLMKTDLTISVDELKIVTCFDVLPKHMLPSKSYFIAYFGSQVLLFYLVPSLIMGFCYTAIIRTLLTSSSSQLTETKRHTVYLIVVLLTIFVVCYVPNIVITIMHLVYAAQEKTVYVEYKLSLALNSLNCCFDPFVYYFCSKEFRRKVRRKICRCLPETSSEKQSMAITLREVQ
ncbi:PREDICTED: P2Y purinoceptor 8-like [Gavialis gangeticus]|uniref:P2Y purinoceptor 8-like n=1 Tax=Gavialis gangeticus TaxID=94835 RepID=UPI00092EF20E|nr:PREDICTED: P2Y purinoceptor 8-like [Gavialis gangeticus]XP_019381174.1 PREDICTED: P2Y purinoceptor 8-like [Gavialis gangeticus]